MKKFITIVKLFSFYLFPIILFAQRPNSVPDYKHPRNANWMFSMFGRINMSNGTPSTESSNVEYMTKYASVSDPQTGELLFYGFLDTLYDKYGNHLQNGSALVPQYYYSLSDNEIFPGPTLISPIPGNDSKYYVFGTISLDGATRGDVNAGRLFYSVVDMNLNNGLGGVDPNQKLIPIDSNFTDRYALAKGDNCNIWLLAIKNDLSKIYAYEINSSGLNTTPVISNITPTFNGMNLSSFASNEIEVMGSIAVAPDNSRIAVTLNGVDLDNNLNLYTGGVILFDFNERTGQVYNQLTLMRPTLNLFDDLVYDAEFSPDSKKLYITHGLLNFAGISQFDLDSYDFNSIMNSKFTISTPDVGFYSPIRLAADDKIYVGSFGGGLTFGSLQDIHRLENPNAAGGALVYTNGALVLPAFSEMQITLGSTTIGDTRTYPIYSSHNKYLCIYDDNINLSVEQNRRYTYRWNTGDSTATISVNTPGKYWVEYGTRCPIDVDTFYVELIDPDFSLGDDIYICKDKVDIIIDPRIEGVDKYTWHDGSNLPTYRATEAGDISLEIDIKGCIFKDEIEIIKIDIEQNLGNDTLVCMEAPFNIVLRANVPENGEVTWSDGSNADTLLITKPGIYAVNVKYENYCKDYDVIRIEGTYCDCDVFVPNAFSPNGDGLNDEFEVKVSNDCNISGFYISIYDRWGKLVFESDNIEKKWDGKFKNNQLNSETYFYHIQFEKGSNHTFFTKKGSINLIR